MVPPGNRSQEGEPLTGAELEAWRGMLRVSGRLRHELDRRLRERHGLTIAEYDVLVRLAEQRGGRMRMTELSEAVLQPKSSLTRIVASLGQRALVERRGVSDDGRGSEAVLTSAGRAAYRRAQRSHHDAIRALFLDQLDDAQLRQLARAWESVDPKALEPAPDE